jgi:hypothetical protein
MTENKKGFDVGAILDEEFSAWVDFVEGAELHIRYLSPDRINEINKRVEKPKKDNKGRVKKNKRTGETIPHIDPVEANVALCKNAIIDWRGLVLDGEEYPCNDENKEKLARRYGLLVETVMEVCDDLEELKKAKDKAIEGNSGSTSDAE